MSLPLPLPRLELQCFGPPTARLDGREAPPEVLWKRHLALLIYLALSPDRTRTRSHLLGQFWPEKPEAKARHALNEALLRLRQALGAGRLRSHEDAVTLEHGALAVDALEFAAAAQDPQRAAALLRGDFLEGFILDEAPAFEDWVMSERQRYRARGAAALVALGEVLLAECRFGDASDAARRALALELHTEPAVRLLMRAAALGGDGAAALSAYHAFAAALERDIGEKPSRELTALSERIRQQRSRAALPAEPDAEPPLVGREAVHREAFRLVSAGITEGPRALMITGAPGMGRTRLASECARRLALEGATVALARPLASDHDAGWSALRLLLRAGVHRAPGLMAVDADTLGVLAWLVPELAERAAAREPGDAARVATALAAALAAAAEEQPIGLAIDDAHLADGATLETLRAALSRLRRAPVVLILTAVDPDPDASPELLQLRAAVGRELPGASVRLGPLGDADMRALVDAQAPWCRDDGERDRLARRLTFETGGNPFFAVTLLGGLQRLSTMRRDFVTWPEPQATFDTPLPFSIPNLARMAIAARVAELDAENQRVLSAAAIGGIALDLGLIGTLTGQPAAMVAELLAPAERRHLVGFDGERYAFLAPLIAEVVRGECLTPGQRKALRLRAVEALAARTDLEGRALRVELWAAAEPGPAALEEAVAVARAALAAGAARTARRALAAAERAAAKGQGAQRAVLDDLRAQVGP